MPVARISIKKSTTTWIPSGASWTPGEAQYTNSAMRLAARFIFTGIYDCALLPEGDEDRDEAIRWLFDDYCKESDDFSIAWACAVFQMDLPAFQAYAKTGFSQSVIDLVKTDKESAAHTKNMHALEVIILLKAVLRNGGTDVDSYGCPTGTEEGLGRPVAAKAQRDGSAPSWGGPRAAEQRRRLST